MESSSGDPSHAPATRAAAAPACRARAAPPPENGPRHFCTRNVRAGSTGVPGLCPRRVTRCPAHRTRFPNSRFSRPTPPEHSCRGRRFREIAKKTRNHGVSRIQHGCGGSAEPSGNGESTGSIEDPLHRFASVFRYLPGNAGPRQDRSGVRASGVRARAPKFVAAPYIYIAPKRAEKSGECKKCDGGSRVLARARPAARLGHSSDTPMNPARTFRVEKCRDVISRPPAARALLPRTALPGDSEKNEKSRGQQNPAWVWGVSRIQRERRIDGFH